MVSRPGLGKLVKKKDILTMNNEIRGALLKYLGYLILIAFQGISFGYVWFVIFAPYIEEIGRGFYFWGNYAVIGVYVLFTVFFTKNFDGYKIETLKTRNTLLSNVLAIFCANVLGYIQVALISVYFFSMLPMLILVAVQWLFVLLWCIMMRLLYTRLVPPTKLLVVFGEHDPKDLVEKTSKIKNKLHVISRISIYAGGKALEEAVLKHKSILLYDLPSDQRSAILKFCYYHKKSVFLTPKLSDIMIRGAKERNYFDTPMMEVQKSGLSIEDRIVKRVSDVIMAIIAIVISSPFMLIFGMCIKLYDRGCVFYLQERMTVDGKLFRMIKFRSMRENAEVEGAQLAKRSDSRITPIGKFLRTTHLDELPQIFNILKGDMSFVGPRPERAEIAKEYEKHVPEFGYRLSVKAGLTGYAQIYGKYNTTPYDKLRLDLKYIEEYSYLLDIKLLFMTFKVMFQSENTEGVQEEQKTAVRRNQKGNQK